MSMQISGQSTHHRLDEENNLELSNITDFDNEDPKSILRNFFKSSNKNRRINYTLFMNALAKVYGKNLTDRIGDLDFLKKKKVELLKKSKKGQKVVTISRKTAALAMVAISSQLRIEDIEEYRINNSDNGSTTELTNCVFKDPFSFLGLGDKFMSSEIKNLKLSNNNLKTGLDYVFNHSKNKKNGF